MEKKLVSLQREKTWTSAAQAIYALAQYTDKSDLSLAEIKGYTTHAFRINIHPESVSPAGPTMFAPYELVAKGLKTIGLRNLSINEPAPLAEKYLADAITFIQTRIDKGFPMIAWNLFSPEFGLIYGYDHEKQVLLCKEGKKERKLKYLDINSRPLHHVFLCGLYDSVEKTIPVMLQDALGRIIDHLEGRSPYGSYEYKHGLEGYRAWIQAFHGRKMDPVGNAYNMLVVSDARMFAAQFFKEILRKWQVVTLRDQQVAACLQRCRQLYQKVYESYQPLVELFPFPAGGNPYDTKDSQEAIAALNSIWELEKEGLVLLKELQEYISQYEDETLMVCKKTEKLFEYIGEDHLGEYRNYSTEIAENIYNFLGKARTITPRTNIEIITHEPKKSEAQQNGSYTVGLLVYFEPKPLPANILFRKTHHEYGFIRGYKTHREDMYKALESWFKEKEYEVDSNKSIIEIYIPTATRSADRELELYIPIKKG